MAMPSGPAAQQPVLRELMGAAPGRPGQHGGQQVGAAGRVPVAVAFAGVRLTEATAASISLAGRIAWAARPVLPRTAMQTSAVDRRGK